MKIIDDIDVALELMKQHGIEPAEREKDDEGATREFGSPSCGGEENNRCEQ